MERRPYDWNSDDDPGAAAYVAERCRAMSAEEKLRTAFNLRATAWELKAAYIRSRNPELSDAAVQDRVRAAFARDISSRS